MIDLHAECDIEETPKEKAYSHPKVVQRVVR
jgi:hypothetical protein